MLLRREFKGDRELGRRLAKLRNSAGKTQQDVADYVGVRRQQISNYENGRCIISHTRVQKIEAFLAGAPSSGLSEDQASYRGPTNDEQKFLQLLQAAKTSAEALSADIDNAISASRMMREA